jgi:hypothetical protein
MPPISSIVTSGSIINSLFPMAALYDVNRHIMDVNKRIKEGMSFFRGMRPELSIEAKQNSF